MDFLSTVTFMVSLLALSVILLAVGAKMRSGELVRNNFIGVRTRSTLANDAAWEAGHKAGALSMVMAGLSGLVLLVLAGALCLLGLYTSAFVVTSVGHVVAVGLVLYATLQANKAARVYL